MLFGNWENKQFKAYLLNILLIFKHNVQQLHAPYVHCYWSCDFPNYIRQKHQIQTTSLLPLNVTTSNSTKLNLQQCILNIWLLSSFHLIMNYAIKIDAITLFFIPTSLDIQHRDFSKYGHFLHLPSLLTNLALIFNL